MTTLVHLNDCATRARHLPAILGGFSDTPRSEGPAFADELLADLDVTLGLALDRMRVGGGGDAIAEQVMQLKAMVYDLLAHHLRSIGWSETSLAALSFSAECDLADSRERLAAAVAPFAVAV